MGKQDFVEFFAGGEYLCLMPYNTVEWPQESAHKKLEN